MIRIFLLVEPISHELTLSIEQYCFLLEKVKSMPCNLSAQYVSRSSSVLLTKTKVTNTSAGRKLYTCLNPLVQWFLFEFCLYFVPQQAFVMLLLPVARQWWQPFSVTCFFKVIESVFQKLSEQLQSSKFTFLVHSSVSTGPWILFHIKS